MLPTLMTVTLLITALVGTRSPFYSDIDSYFTDEKMKAVGGRAIKLERAGFDDKVKLSYVEVPNPTDIPLCINHHQFNDFTITPGRPKNGEDTLVIFPYGLLNKESKWSAWVGPLASWVENYNYLEIAPGESARVYREEDLSTLAVNFDMKSGETYDVVSFLHAADCSKVRGSYAMFSHEGVFEGIEDLVANRVTSIPNAAVGIFDHEGGIFYWHVHQVTR